MSADVSSTAVPGNATVTIASANVALPIALPRAAAYVSVEFKVNAGQVAWGGTEGVSLGNACMDQAAGQVVAWPVYQPPRGAINVDAGKAILYVQTAVAGTVVSLQFSRGD